MFKDCFYYFLRWSGVQTVAGLQEELLCSVEFTDISRFQDLKATPEETWRLSVSVSARCEDEEEDDVEDRCDARAMLRGGLSLVSVSLCLVCLTAAPLLAGNCSKDLLKKVKTLLTNAKELKELECKLYTPTVDHYKNCSQSTMKCLVAETKVLFLESEAADLSEIGKDKEEMVENLEDFFYQMSPDPETDCLTCESLEVKNAETFVKGFQSILQSMCSLNMSAV